jgi:uncharacterized protein YgiM (DUF1202 family)
LVFSACNLPISPIVQGDMLATLFAQTMSAQTNVADIVAGTLGAMATDTPLFTLTPPFTLTPSLTPSLTLTPSPTLTPTSAVVTVRVSVDTNCRTGPGKVYDMSGSLLVGQTAEVVGRAADNQYWVIRDPKDPTNICWLWGYYATLAGNTAALPVITPPPTPAPAPSFTFEYNSWGLGPGYQCFKFDVKNTGAVTWESYTLTLHNSVHGTTATSSSNEFINYDNWCISTGSQMDLTPGETGTASVKTFLAYNPAGETFEATLTLCSENALGGACKSKTINFSP